MKSVFITYLILLVLIVNIRHISSVSFGHAISLYNASDKITVFTSENFSTTVNQSDTAWLVEFYASWCGHCRTYAATYREVGINAWMWRSVVRIGAMNCYGGKNLDICRQLGLRGYPTIRLIPPGTVFNNGSISNVISANEAKDVTKDLINHLSDVHRKYKIWPHFTPVNRITFEELYARIPTTTKLLFIVAENRDDLTGRQIMLDFSKYREQLAIYRITNDGRRWHKLNISITDVPALFIILRNRTAVRIPINRNISNPDGNRNLFNQAIRTYINQTKSFENFDDHEFEEVTLNKKALKAATKRQKVVRNRNATDDFIDRNTVHHKVNMIDLELALSHMFRQEIPQMKDIQSEKYDALVRWLTVLTKYFPGREPVMNYLKHLLLRVNEQSNGFSGDRFEKMVDMKTSNAYLPRDDRQYQHCAGSESQYRGYPCALWLLFHTLTVSQYQKESNQSDVLEIPSAIKGYMKHFFGCRQCSDNFMKETNNMTQLNTKNKYEAIVYLWRVHNHVNKRLRGDTSEDPKHPKVQFPSRSICETCKPPNSNKHDVSDTLEFLIGYYSKANIETVTISQKIDRTKELLDQKKFIISRVDSTNGTIDQFNLFRFIPSVVQQYPLYTFIIFLVIIILFRHRHCKAKRKRYTL